MGMASNERLELFLHKFTTVSDFSEMKNAAQHRRHRHDHRRIRLFTDGEIAPALRASCAYPGLFLPVEYRGRILVDGFLTEAVPRRRPEEWARRS